MITLAKFNAEFQRLLTAASRAVADALKVHSSPPGTTLSDGRALPEGGILESGQKAIDGVTAAEGRAKRSVADTASAAISDAQVIVDRAQLDAQGAVNEAVRIAVEGGPDTAVILAAQSLTRTADAMNRATADVVDHARGASEARAAASESARTAGTDAQAALAAREQVTADRMAADLAVVAAQRAASDAAAARNQVALPQLARYLSAGHAAGFFGPTGQVGTFDVGLGTAPLQPDGTPYPTSALDVVRVEVRDDRLVGGVAGTRRGDLLSVATAEPFRPAWAPDQSGAVPVTATVILRSGASRTITFAPTVAAGLSGRLDFSDPAASGHLATI